MAHTFSSATLQRMVLNDRETGEIGVEGLQIGHFGMPVVMVSAGEAWCREAREWLGDAEVAPTERGLDTHLHHHQHGHESRTRSRSAGRAFLEGYSLLPSLFGDRGARKRLPVA